MTFSVNDSSIVLLLQLGFIKIKPLMYFVKHFIND